MTRFALVNVVRLRSRELQSGAEARVQATIDDPVVPVALREVLAGAVAWELGRDALAMSAPRFEPLD